MSSKEQQPLPLKKRQSRVSAALEAKAAARELSPMELYWDPRYKSYFYAGTLPAAPGAAAAAARPETATTERQTGSASEVHASTTDLQAGRRKRSILVRSRGSRRRSRARRRRRISFSVDVAGNRSWASDPSRSRRVARVCLATAVCATFLLLWVLVVLWVSGYLEDHEYPLTETERDPATVRSTTTADRDETSTEKEEAERPDDEKKHKDDRRAGTFTTTEILTVGSPSKTPQRHHDGTNLASHVCLYTHRDDTLYNYEQAGNSQTPADRRRSRHCDVLIRCCYVLENDMTLRPETSWTGASKPRPQRLKKRRGGDRYNRPWTALAAVLERDSAFSKLLAPGDSRARRKFARNALRLARSEGYAGVRLWLHEADALRVVTPSFARKVRHVATALRKANCTVGFFLPYPATHPRPARYAAGLRALANALNSPQSTLLYPTASVLRNHSRWPSPTKMAVIEKNSAPTGRAEISPRRSVCYLLLSAMAVSVAISNATATCDVDKVQRVSVSQEREFLTRTEFYELCRSWNSSWKLSSHLYHSYSCGFGEHGREGVVFQTSQQAGRFYKKLLDLSRSSCFGFVDGESGLEGFCDHVPVSLT
ncbi:uncharacterized protein LOC142570551 [Dermacentor variabilis]|uniref:uncharacterized protein LOC142570551 n=1 Tax=Dermacentor variabilis TaxID=34621 RepID=UPI003F5BF043